MLITLICHFLHFDFLRKTKKNWVFLRTKNKEKRKNFSALIFKFLLLTQQIKNFKKKSLTAK